MKGKKGEEMSEKKIKVEWVGRETEQECSPQQGSPNKQENIPRVR